MNEFKGFHPASDWKPKRIPFDIKPSDFFYYVKERIPVILTGFKGFDWLQVSELNRKLGKEMVQVERKSNGQFGHAETRLNMKFEDFLVKLPTKEYYLTTQYEEEDLHLTVDEDDENDINQEIANERLLKSFTAPPLNALLPDLPFQLEIFGNLILHQVVHF
jgi:hypothetical protein